MTTLTTKPKHEAAYQDLCDILRKHELSSPELLAVCAILFGKVIAMQDQRSMTMEIAMEIVLRNIEIGNSQVLAGLLDSKGTA